ncbi:MAG: VWA domain-containing protein, partial [Planctomycetales bacterium]|nr:VWA domain-containing protein [Planctomycetales bacterium]
MSLLAQLGPLDFGSFWMGLWGAAAALPLLIHLLNRRQYREEQWAAMEFLLRALRKHSQRIRVEQLLLLLIRALLVVLTTLAWMDLLWNSSRFGAPGAGHGSLHTVIVIDGSYSMSVDVGGATRFDRAKQLANELVDAGAQGDAFTLVLLGEPPRTIIGQPAFDRQDVQQEIAALRAPHAGADLTAGLAVVEKLLADVAAKNKRISAQRVCFITDLGRNTWGKLDDAALYDQVQRMATTAPMTLLDVGQENVENVALAYAALRESTVVAGRDVHITAQIKNLGAGDRVNHSVRLFVDDRPVAEQRVDVAAGDETTAAFTHAFAAAGEHVVEIRLADDALAVDNHRWLSVPVRDSLSVLCIAGKPQAADHVALALAPERSADRVIRTEIAPESAIEERDLALYDCVVVCNVGRFAHDEATLLRDYVRHDSALIVTPGDQVIAENYNELLAGPQPAPPLLPAQIGDIAAAGPYRFDPRRYEHPLLDVFRGHE